ncbi:MAG: TlyA family RNA methyltransferase [Anaerolineales bacterium]|nr:TlyA family RNA methyltransferase [Anaerolineales bacterium]
MAGKKRLDLLVTERGLADSRALAQRLIREGRVRVADQVSDKPGTLVPEDVALSLDAGPPFVSRGGEKLEAALSAFALDVSGRACADVGASTGGFTDCLLQRGARLVYAIDVGYGQLDWRLRNDPRVVVLERMNARNLERLPGPVSLVTVDVSFISLRLILPRALAWLSAAPDAAEPGEGRHVVALVKPQFEAGRRDVPRGGVVRDPEVHRRVLASVLDAAAGLGFGVRGAIASPLRGPAGNVEFLAWWQLGADGQPAEPLIDAVLGQAEAVS